uniref:ATP synthase subunit a n=1 Tax=Chamberlainia hainesiana TaxID=1264661 RepID=A0A513X0B1_9BIVA|nr:ATP synthase F0 subunit 6 [Chamberlainia hainesiana]
MLVDIFSSLDFYVSIWDYESIEILVSYFSFVVGGLMTYQVSHQFWVYKSVCCFVEDVISSMMFKVVSNSKGMYFGVFGLGSMSLFLSVFVVNIGGMIPGSLSVTSHLSVAFGLSLVWWMWSIFSGLVYSADEVLAHLLPMGTPVMLCPLMVLIETVSVLIRPVTLSVRLAANITMGHLVLSLAGDWLIDKVWVWVLGPYVLFEFFVCGLQAYVFSLLIVLYSADHP